MPISIDDIAPAKAGATPVAPAPAPAPQAAPTPAEPSTKEGDDDATIPDEVLQIPAFGALLRGAPPAVLVPPDDRSPEVLTVEKNVQPLLDAGFGFYRSQQGSVFFNTQFISAEEVKLADEKGRLDDVAPPIGELRDFFSKELPQDDTPAPSSPSGASAAPAAPMNAPAPAPVQKAIANNRMKNVAIGAPTSGPAPGGGRLLNSILKPAV